MSGDVTLRGASTDTVSDVCTVKSLTVFGDTTLLANVAWARRAPTLSRCGAPVILGDASADAVWEGSIHGDGAPTPSVELPLSSTAASLCDESVDAITFSGGIVAMAGSLSLSGDVTLESDGTDTVTINGAISVASTLIVSGATDGAMSNTGTVGLGNEATDFVTISVTGAAYVQGAVTLGNEATDVTVVAGRRDLRRWRRYSGC